MNLRSTTTERSVSGNYIKHIDVKIAFGIQYEFLSSLFIFCVAVLVRKPLISKNNAVHKISIFLLIFNRYLNLKYIFINKGILVSI